MADRHNVVITPEIEDRFWAKVDKRGPNECWPWIGAVRGPKYRAGYFSVYRIIFTAPQVALIVDGRARPQPPNDHALHSCDNPQCVNPAHLRWGSHQENMRDRTERNLSFNKGPRRRWSKLTEEQVSYVLVSPKLGYALAEELGVHKATISDIRCGKTWKRLTGDKCQRKSTP